MNPQDKIPALKQAMPNDPVVDILGDLCKQTGAVADRMDSVEAAGMTLRYTRIVAFFIMFVMGLMAGLTIARSHYEKPDSLDDLRSAGVRVFLADDGTQMSLDVEGSTYQDAHLVYDKQHNKVGVIVIYRKEPQL
jgi:hypothetical protein